MLDSKFEHKTIMHHRFNTKELLKDRWKKSIQTNYFVWNFCICDAYAYELHLMYDDQIAKARCSMTHAKLVIARRAVEEVCVLVVIVNKMIF